MQSIELLGDTKKLEGISAQYLKGGIVTSVFKSREIKDGTKILYEINCNPDLSISFCERNRDCGDKTYMALFNSYKHMQGFVLFFIPLWLIN